MGAAGGTSQEEEEIASKKVTAWYVQLKVKQREVMTPAEVASEADAIRAEVALLVSGTRGEQRKKNLSVRAYYSLCKTAIAPGEIEQIMDAGAHLESIRGETDAQIYFNKVGNLVQSIDRSKDPSGFLGLVLSAELLRLADLYGDLRQGLSAELDRAYSSAGGMHLAAVFVQSRMIGGVTLPPRAFPHFENFSIDQWGQDGPPVFARLQWWRDKMLPLPERVSWVVDSA
jgi:hypothetical protein